MLALMALSALPATASAATSTFWVGPDVFPVGPIAPQDSDEGALPESGLAPHSPTRDDPFALPLLAWDAVTDRFGAPRGEDLVHGGIDLALDSFPSSPVLSACRGTVSVIAESSGYGNYIMVDCGAGWSTLYGHLSASLVKQGEAVETGGLLGVSGNTGFSTGEHLHFEIRYEGVTRNPEDYLDFKIPEGQPLSSGPIVFPSPSPSPSPAATDPTATATAEPETATPTPAPTEAPAPIVDANFSSIRREGDQAAGPMVIRVANQTSADPAGSFVLLVNRLGAGAVAPPAVLVADAACDGCVAMAVLVQLNLHESAVAPAEGSSIQALVTRCGSGCGAFAFAMEIDISLVDADIARLDAFRAALESLLQGISVTPGDLTAPALQTSLESVVAEFPEFAEHVTVTLDQAPDGAFDEARKAGTPSATAKPTEAATVPSTATATHP